MSTIPVTLTDGSTYNKNVEMLTTKQVFQLVSEGRMSFDQFQDWRDYLAWERYAQGEQDTRFYVLDFMK